MHSALLQIVPWIISLDYTVLDIPVVVGEDLRESNFRSCTDYDPALQCGNPESPVNLKIIDGAKTDTTKWPWMAYMKGLV